MRYLLFLSSAVLMAAYGCSKNPANPTPAGTSPQTSNQVPISVSSQTSSESLYPPPDPNRPYVNVDVVVHNSSTNEYLFKFDSGLDNIPVKTFSAGEMATNADEMWANWSSIRIILGDWRTGETHFLNIPLAEVNEQLGSGKYHRLLFQILAPDDVKVACE